MILIGVFRVVLGDPSPRDDTEMLDQMLYAFGAHGLTEQADAGIAAVLPEGPVGLGDALAKAIQAQVLRFPDEVGPDELIGVRDRVIDLCGALASIPHEAMKLRHHLGGNALSSFWQPDDPMNVAMVLTFFVAMLRETPLMDKELVAAIRHQWPAVTNRVSSRQDRCEASTISTPEFTEEEHMTTAAPADQSHAKAAR